MDKPRLLDQVRDALRVGHYSLRTEESYLQWTKRFILFHDKRHPMEMGEQEITAFLTFLAVDKHVAPSTQNQALSALLFLYKEVLAQELCARKTGTERLRMGVSMFEAARVMVLASLPPELSEWKMRRRLCARFYGELADKVYGGRERGSFGNAAG